MDYSPVNITPAGVKQTAYYTTTLGPYDVWAIEYGYKVISGDENAELAKIASRCAEPGLDYATDEDTRSIDPDPLSNRFDLGKDPVAYAQRQMKIVSDLQPKLLERAVTDGEGYQRVRQAFGLLQSEYWRTASIVSRLPGGLLVNRDHKGDPKARPPFEMVDPTQQRAAMKLINEQVFSSPKFEPQLLNSLAATRWSHWGQSNGGQIDFAIHDTIARFQSQVLSRLLSGTTLARIQDGELRVAPDADAYTLAEHLRLTVDGLFGELASPAAGEYSNRKPFLPSFRRNLQQTAIKRLAGLVAPPSGGSIIIIDLGGGGSSGRPEDARVLARMHLQDLDGKIKAVLAKEDLKLDDYSKAHLLDLQERIDQVLNAQVTVNAAN